MRSYIIEILGSYSPITTGGDIGTVDWPFIFGGIVFCICLNFILKLVIKCLFNE